MPTPPSENVFLTCINDLTMTLIGTCTTFKQYQKLNHTLLYSNTLQSLKVKRAFKDGSFLKLGKINKDPYNITKT